eukprot:970290-Ditylum_brightwellii.AAC.1
MKCVVAEKSEEKYTNKNITLLLWLYDSDSLCKELLQGRFIEELHAVAEADANRNHRPKSRHICKTWLNNMVQGEDKACPNILDRMMFNQK